MTLKQIDTVLSLTAEGATIPFIARYRKDMTGSLDEVAIKAIIDLDKSLTNLNDRKEAVLAKIQEQGKLTKELEEAILAAEKLADVEELYLPYKEKRRPKQLSPVRLDFSSCSLDFTKCSQLRRRSRKICL